MQESSDFISVAILPEDGSASGLIFVGVDLWSAGEVKLVFRDEDKQLLLGLKQNTRVFVKPQTNNYSSDILIGLSMVVDIVEEVTGRFPTVSLPYLPYSRQERATEDAPYIGLSVIRKLFHGCIIETSDVHNEEGALKALPSTKLVNSRRHSTIHNLRYLMGVHQNEPTPVIFVAPDQGALSRATLYSDVYLDLTGLESLCVSIDKTRVDGSVNSTFHDGDIDKIKAAVELCPRTQIVVVDDIVDGGRTFVNAASLIKTELRNFKFGGLYLLITHGIFSSSSTLNTLTQMYDGIGVYSNVRCIKGHD